MPTWATTLIILCALGFLRDSVFRVTLSPLDGGVWLAEQALATLARWAVGLREAAARRLAEIQLDTGRWTLAISAVLQTLLFLLIAGTEAVLIALSMATLLNLDDVAWAGGSSVEMLMTGAVLVAGVYSFSAIVMLQDDCASHLTVQHWIQPRSRRLLRGLAWAAFALVALVVLGLATLRAQELIRAETEAAWITTDPATPVPIDNSVAAGEPAGLPTVRHVIQVVVLLASGLTLLFSAGLAWELGVLVLLRLLPALATSVARASVGTLRTLFGLIWVLGRAVRALVRHVLETVLAVATIVARIPAEALRSLYRWGTTARQSPSMLRPLRALVAVLTSIAVDLQLPVSPGGPR